MAGKALVQSKSFWGSLICAIPAAAEIISDAVSTGLLPTPVTPWLVLGGSILSLVGRLTACEPIVRVFPNKLLQK